MGTSDGKHPKPARGRALGILNPWGELWTYDTFHSEAAARKHIADFWGGAQAGSHHIGDFTIVPVRVTVSVLRTPPDRQRSPGKPSK